MTWTSEVLEVYRRAIGDPIEMHSVDAVDVQVGEFHLDDGSVLYGTVGLAAEGGGFFEWELVLHAAKPVAAFPEFVGRMAVPVRRAQTGEVLPLAEDESLPYAGVGVFWVTRMRNVGDGGMFGLRQIAGLTAGEVDVARKNGLETVEAAWWRDGVGRLCEPGRATSPSFGELLPIRPDPTELAGLSPAAQEVMEIAIRVDHDAAEGIRGRFSESDASRLAKLLGERLPHPAQLACLLHALMDFAVPELETVCLRLLQLSPTHEMAGQYYADALGMLAAIAGDQWDDAYFGYESDFDAACEEARSRREAAGLEVVYGIPPNPFAA